MHLSAEEEIAAEESLSICCKPVELYNVLQRRATVRVTFFLSNFFFDILTFALSLDCRQISSLVYWLPKIGTSNLSCLFQESSSILGWTLAWCSCCCTDLWQCGVPFSSAWFFEGHCWWRVNVQDVIWFFLLCTIIMIYFFH